MLFSTIQLALQNCAALTFASQLHSIHNPRRSHTTAAVKRQHCGCSPPFSLCALRGRSGCHPIEILHTWPNVQLCNVFSYHLTSFAVGLLACLFFLLTSLSALLVRVVILSFLRLQLKANLILLSIDASSVNFQLCNQALIFVYRVNLTAFVACAVLLVLVIM